MRDVVIYSVGAVHASACASIDVSTIDIETFANQHAPTGIDHGWSVSKEPSFATGDPNPCPCNIDPERRHYLLVC